MQRQTLPLLLLFTFSSLASRPMSFKVVVVLVVAVDVVLVLVTSSKQSCFSTSRWHI